MVDIGRDSGSITCLSDYCFNNARAYAMTIKIDYFCDILCVWAYSGQVRVDELKREFGDNVEIHYRFIPVFAAARDHIEKSWPGGDSLVNFNRHLRATAKQWAHVVINPAVWRDVAPESSACVHLYLKAIQILEQQGEISAAADDSLSGHTLFEHAMWQFREAFFRDAKNISLRSVQDEIAEGLGLPLDAISRIMNNGRAHAELHLDDEARQLYKVPGSPTLVLNEGRQILYGNVGYRVIEVNVREMMHNPEQGEASWC